jgi:mannose-6-phosphate isomerase-like protein (cupin superfamily)
MTTATAPLAVPAGAGESLGAFGAQFTVKLTGQDTGGELSLLEVEVPAGYSAPLHVHYAEDETFRILDGDVTFEVGGERIESGAGDTVFGPRNIPHRFESRGGARMIWVLTPGGFEDMVREASDPANQDRLPEIVKKYGNELL